MKYIFLNLKAYLNLEQTISICEIVKERSCSSNSLCILPSIESLSHCCKLYKTLSFGAQNISPSCEPNLTGEPAANVLKELGISYALIGHSERRTQLGENNQLLRQKLIVANELAITPIICCGEAASQRNQWQSVVSSQLDSLSPLLNNSIIAYEPLWSIGTGVTPSITEIEEIYNFMKQKYNRPIVYGGSVNSKNLKSILDITDGTLIGKSSTIPDELSTIIATHRHYV